MIYIGYIIISLLIQIYVDLYIYIHISRSTNEISGASPESQDMWEKEVTPAEEEKAKVKAGMG